MILLGLQDLIPHRDRSQEKENTVRYTLSLYQHSSVYWMDPFRITFGNTQNKFLNLVAPQQPPPPPPQQQQQQPQQLQQAGSGGGLRHQTLERTAAPPARAPPRRSERRVPSWQGAGASPLTPLLAARPALAAIANEAADQQAAAASPVTPLGCCLPEEEQSSGDDEVCDDEARGVGLGAGSAQNFLGELLTRLPARRQGADRSSDEQVFACD